MSIKVQRRKLDKSRAHFKEAVQHLPLGVSSTGLPIGSQLVGAYGREDQLLRLAAQTEAAEPWAHRMPTISAT